MKSTKSASLLPDLRLRFVSGHRYDGRVRPLPKDTPRSQSIPSYHSSRELGCVPFTLTYSVSVYSSERTLGATTVLFNVCEWKSSKSFLKLQILIQRFEVIEKKKTLRFYIFYMHTGGPEDASLQATLWIARSQSWESWKQIDAGKDGQLFYSLGMLSRLTDDTERASSLERPVVELEKEKWIPGRSLRIFPQ